MKLLATFFMAALPVGKVLITCGVGAYLAHPSVNVLTEDARRLLNKLVVVAFTPALVFSKLARAVSYENIWLWWYMPFSILISFACGFAMGMLVVKYTSVPPHLKNLTLACCAAGNTGNVPLVLVPAICQEEGSPFGRSEVCSRTAVAYISYGLWTGIVLTWTFIYKLLCPPGFHPKSSVPAIAISSGSPQSSEFGDFQTGGHHHEVDDFNPRSDNISTFTSSVSKHNDFGTSSSLPPPSFQVSKTGSPSSPPAGAPPFSQDPIGFVGFFVEKYELKTVMTPPTYAAALGLLVGGIPPLKSLFEGPFLVLTDSADIIGQAMIPAMNMVLGATLVQGSGLSELAMPSIVGIILVRLVAMPMVGLILIKIVHDWGFLPPDPLFRFVLMLQYTMPTGINIGQHHLPSSPFFVSNWHQHLSAFSLFLQRVCFIGGHEISPFDVLLIVQLWVCRFCGNDSFSSSVPVHLT